MPRLYIDRHNTDQAGYTELHFIVKDAHRRKGKLMTGIKVLPAAWDQKGQQLLKGRGQYEVDLINKMLAHYTDIIRAEEIKGSDLSYMRLQLARQAGQIERRVPDPLMMFDYVMEHYAGVLSSNYLRKFIQVRDRLASFRPSIQYSDFNRTTLTAYVSHLADQGLGNATIREHIKAIRKTLKEAELLGQQVPPDYKAYTYKIQSQEPVYLSWDEVLIMALFEINETSRAIIRDTFIFRCYTGIRWSDMANVRQADDYAYMVLQIAKQKKYHRVAMVPQAAEILRRYDGRLPVFAQQTENEYIKGVAEAAGIDTAVTRFHYSGSSVKQISVPKWKMITTHTARRTFARHWVVDMGGSIFNLSKYLGHSSVKVTMDYIGITEDEINQEVLRLFL